jgi:hypothetical protein
MDNLLEMKLLGGNLKLAEMRDIYMDVAVLLVLECFNPIIDG